MANNNIDVPEICLNIFLLSIALVFASASILFVYQMWRAVL